MQTQRLSLEKGASLPWSGDDEVADGIGLEFGVAGRVVGDYRLGGRDRVGDGKFAVGGGGTDA